MHRYHPQDRYLILNEFFLNEQVGASGRKPEDMSPEDLERWPDSNPHNLPAYEPGFWDWFNSLSRDDLTAILALLGAGTAFVGVGMFTKKLWQGLRALWRVFFHDGVQGANDLNAWISRTFGIDGIMPDVDDTMSEDSILLWKIFAFIVDDDFGGAGSLEAGDTFSGEDIEVMMHWFGFQNVPLQDGSGFFEAEIGHVHAIVEVLMDSMYAGGIGTFAVYLAGILGGGSLLAAGSVTIGGVVVTGTMAFFIVAALYLLTYAIANGINNLDAWLESLGFDGFNEAYDDIEIIDFRGPNKPKPGRDPGVQLKPYELDSDDIPYEDRFPPEWPFWKNYPELGDYPYDPGALGGTLG